MKFTKYLTRFIFVASMLSIAATRYSYMPQSTEFPVGSIVTVAGGSLKLRAEPSLDAKIVDAMPEGSILVVLDGPQYSGDIEWYKVDYEGKQGWASKKYMQITSLPEQQPAQDPAPESVPVDSPPPEEVNTPVVDNESQPLLPPELFSNFSNFSSSLICGGIVFFLVLYQAIRWFSRKDSPTIFVETVSIALAVVAASYVTIRVIGGNLSVFMAVLIDYSAVGVITFIAYGFDKKMSEVGAFRISEAGLHFMEALGGWVGALIAQPTFNHKWKKFTYMFVFWIIVIAHIGLLWGIFSR